MMYIKNNNPILGICGDSFFAATQNDNSRLDAIDSEGKHFSEILAKKLKYELFTLARGACSNSCIKLQIDEMIKRRVDFVIVGTTTPNRIEYQANDKPYIVNNGIYNIVYNCYHDKSSLDPRFGENVLYSDTIGNILVGNAPVRDSDQLDAIRKYFEFIYNDDFKRHQDSWIIASGIQDLKNAKIPYLLLGHWWLAETNYFNENNVNDRILLNSHLNLSGNNKLIPFTYTTVDETGPDGNTMRRWHVSDKNQIRIAEHLHEYINSTQLLKWREYEQ